MNKTLPSMKANAIMSTTAKAAVTILLEVLLAAGCGGGDSSGACGSIGPCGGDLKGQWNVTEACMSKPAAMQLFNAEFQDWCPTGTVRGTDLHATGAMSFGADMAYDVSFTLSGTITFGFPTTCFSGLTCAEANALIQLELQQNPDPAVQSITCTGGDLCSCLIVIPTQTIPETGTYSTTGTSLATLSSTGSTDVQQYCVQGDTLHMIELYVPMNLGPMGKATVGTDIVGVRKK